MLNRRASSLHPPRLRGRRPERKRIEHFSTVEDAFGIEDGAEGAHDFHLGVAGEFREERFFGEADAVFAGDGAAEANGFVEDFFEGFFDPVLELMDHAIREGFVRPEQRQLLVSSSSPKELLEMLRFDTSKLACPS